MVETGLEAIPFKTPFLWEKLSKQIFLNNSGTWMTDFLRMVLWIIIFQSSTKSSKGLDIKPI